MSGWVRFALVQMFLAKIFKCQIVLLFVPLIFPFDFQLKETQFEGLLTTILGYLVISCSLVILHLVAAVAKLKR